MLKKAICLTKNSLQVKIAVLYAILVLVPLLFFGLYNTNLITQEIESVVIKNTTEAIKQQLQNTDDLYSRLLDVAYDIMLRPQINQTLQDYDGIFSTEGIRQFNQIKEQLTSIIVRRTEIQDIALICGKFDPAVRSDKQFVISVNKIIHEQNLQHQRWFVNARNDPNSTQFVGEDNRDYYLKKFKTTPTSDMLLVKGFKNINNNKTLGIIVITVSQDQLKKTVAQFGNSLQSAQSVSDSNGTVLFENAANPDVRRYFTQNSDKPPLSCEVSSWSARIADEEYLLLSGQSERSGIKIEYAIPKNIMFGNILKIRSINTLIVLLCLALSFVVLVAIFKGVFVPINQLQKVMSAVEHGDLTARANAAGNHEIGKLADGFNKMVTGIEEKNKLLVEQEQKKRKFELMALQAQINPHFLYNTLDSIKWIAIAQENEPIRKMTHSLIALLRKTISNTQEFISIQEELDSMNHYIEIQRLRYYDSFDYTVTVQAGAHKGRIPKLILQPLVENALFHGVYNCGRRGAIHVHVKKDGADSVIFIKDNGKGMNREDWCKRAAKPRNESFSGVGVANVDERIKLHYGDGYGLTFDSVIDEYTIVIVRIPYREREETEHVEGSTGR